MALGLSRISELMPSEEGSSKGVLKTEFRYLLAQAQHLFQKVDVGARVGLRDSRTIGRSSPPNSSQFLILPL